MYLHNLTLQNIKLFKRLDLNFKRGKLPRMWTVLVGENGTCKTTLLQAIAMAASGPTIAGQLATSGRVDLLRSLRRRGGEGDARIVAKFGFSDLGHEGYKLKDGTRHPRDYPGWEHEPRPECPPILSSQLYQMAGSQRLSGVSSYSGKVERVGPTENDPLELLRSREPTEPHWFVAGYGVYRNLPQPEGTIGRSGVQERLQSLFGNHTISATRWADHFRLTGNTDLENAFGATLREIIRRTAELLPDVQDINLAVEDPASKRDPIERHRVLEQVDGMQQELPTVWMSQGYQSSIAWISDLVGQILVEAQVGVPPKEMEGLVLIDEIDLHLHPTWQVGLIQALRETFERLQFVVTTHSPLVITGCKTDEIIRLERRRGEVVQVERPAPDPLTLTGSELYWNYFELEQLVPNPLGQDLYDYQILAGNGARTPDEESRLKVLSDKLDAHGMRPQRTVLPPRGNL